MSISTTKASQKIVKPIVYFVLFDKDFFFKSYICKQYICISVQTMLHDIP